MSDYGKVLKTINYKKEKANCCHRVAYMSTGMAREGVFWKHCNGGIVYA